jgi:hypothetical protein
MLTYAEQQSSEIDVSYITSRRQVFCKSWPMYQGEKRVQVLQEEGDEVGYICPTAHILELRLASWVVNEVLDISFPARQ